MANTVLERNPYFNGGQNFNDTQNRGPYERGSGFGASSSQSQYQPYGARPEDLDAMYQMPSAEPDDIGRMTVEDSISKSMLLFGVVIVSAIIAAMLPVQVMFPIAIFSAIAALVMGLVITFSRTVRVRLIGLFAVAEGLFVGALTSVLERMFAGIAIQAVLATFAVVGVTLFLYRSGRVRTSAKMDRIFFVAAIAYLIFGLVNFALSATGVIKDPFGLRSSVEIFGIPLGLILGVFAVALGAYMLVSDFEFIESGARRGAPRKYGWLGAYALVSTVVFIYIEILRMIAILRGNRE